MAEFKVFYTDLNEEAQQSIRMQLAKDLEYDKRVEFEVEWIDMNAGKSEEDIEESCDDYIDEMMDKWLERIDEEIDDYINKYDMGTEIFI